MTIQPCFACELLFVDHIDCRGGNTPLMIASAYARDSIVRLLLAEYHANVNEKNRYSLVIPDPLLLLQAPQGVQCFLMHFMAAMAGPPCATAVLTINPVLGSASSP